MRYRIVPKFKTWWTEREGPLEELPAELSIIDPNEEVEVSIVSIIKEVQVYKDSREEWRWRLIAHNGRRLGDSGEGYKDQRDCLSMAAELFPGAYLHILET